MGVVGPSAPNSTGAGGAGAFTWTNTGNIATLDAVSASVAFVASNIGDESDDLRAGFDLSSVSSTVVVVGIEVGVYCQQSASGELIGLRARFHDGAGYIGTDYGDVDAPPIDPSPLALVRFGGAADTWGGLTIANLKGTNTRFCFAVIDPIGAAANTCVVDYISLTLTFAPGSGGMLARTRVRSRLARGR